MRLVPGSLAVRLTLILLAGLLLAQAASLAIHWRDRDRTMRTLGGTLLVPRLVGVTKVLDRVPAEMRAAVARDLSSRNLTFEVVSEFPDIRSLPEQGRFGRMLERRLHRQLGDHRSLRIQVDGMPFLPPHHMHHGMPPPPLSEVYAAVSLKDGEAVIFRGGILAEDLDEGSWRLLVSLAVMVLIVLLLTAVIVRLATRPLCLLAKGADALGRDLNRPPLPEQGPHEVVTAARALNQLQQHMQESLAERSNMLAAVSHDLKTPLTRLRLRAEMLDDQGVAGKINQDLGDMEAMINETLMFMRGMEKRERDEAVNILQMLDGLAGDLDSDTAHVRIRSLAAEPVCMAQPLALKRCFANIIGNALKYGGDAEVVVSGGAGRLTVSVSDHGPGIPEQEMERVFEPFYRVERSRSRDTGGTGMGLAIARNIVRLHGGDIALENRAGGGLRVGISLPCAHRED